MGFAGVYRAVYDYTPQAEGELAIEENDILYILENNADDGWWKAKKKAGTEDEDEPIGLVPGNYVEQAPSIANARTLYEYTRQTDEELSFPEDVAIEIFDTSDPDWILAGYDGDYGFVPANYIDMQDPDTTNAVQDDVQTSPPAPALPARLPSVERQLKTPSESPSTNPAAAIAGVVQGLGSSLNPSRPQQSPRQPSRNLEPQVSDDEGPTPALPSRPRPAPEPSVSSTYVENEEGTTPAENYRAPGGFHMYNINEMVSVMGKRKKMPTTLGINLGTGVILIAPEHAQDGPSQEWTADRMSHYSREGKHVFMELVRPSKSIDFHAGAKDTAEEIVAALGDLAGAVRAEGLREVIMAGSNHSLCKGEILYDFMAQGNDEVTVAAGDEVIVIDDSKSDEWWQVRRLKTGKEGVVPRSYIEVTGSVTPPPASPSLSSAKATVKKNRLDEIRLTKEAIKAGKEPYQVGPGMLLPDRGSSLMAGESHYGNSSQQRDRRENGSSEGGVQPKRKSKPDPSKVRTWTDRSKSFSVEAQFLGLKDGKIHLHKMNGVIIAVPIAKMSYEDLEYVENVTGVSLDDERPLSDVKRSKNLPDVARRDSRTSGASEDKEKPEYDWFQFFLSCDIAVGLCQRYAQVFLKDSMDESVLPDVDATVLRNLGLREGDIIKVMRTLDAKYGRSHGGSKTDGEGGLFSGPGGALLNNTRKARPAPAVQTSDYVDVAAFSNRDASSPQGEPAKSSEPASSPRPREAQRDPSARTSGFDDSAWDVKSSKPQQQQQRKLEQAHSTSQPTSAETAAPSPALTESMQDLSLLTQPLEPIKSSSQPTSRQDSGQQPARLMVMQPQPTGASPSFFNNLPQPHQQGMTVPETPSLSLGGQISPHRQRPMPPQTTSTQGSILPPPQRPLSAPQSAQQSAFAPPALSPQMTGSLQSQPAPPGQSLSELMQARMQQQYLAQMQQQRPQQIQPTMTGFPSQGIPSYPTGPPGQLMQPSMTGGVGQGPFADPIRPQQFSPLQAQPTGFQSPYSNMQPQYPQHAGGFNSYLPPALEPQRTGIPTQTQAVNPNMPLAQPLQPQKTGPPPPVRFGVTGETKRLTAQQTGRKANLSQATPDNPFGF